jgi:sugar-phosphatase
VEKIRFRCSAVLFDLDGVLVHSAEAVDRSWRRWALDNALDPDVVAAAAHGRRTVDTIRHVAPALDAARVAASLEAAQSMDLDCVQAGAGAAELLAALRPHEWAVVTSGSRHLALSRLHAAGLPEPRVLVAGDEVDHGKPDPAGYLLACAHLRLPPAAGVVVEDAPAGVAAARAAGISVVALTNGGDADRLAEADALARSCAQLRLSRAHGALVIEITETREHDIRCSRPGYR